MEKEKQEIEKVYEHGLGRRSSRSVRTFLSAVTGAFSATVAIESAPASVAIALSLFGSVWSGEAFCCLLYKRESA